MLHDIRLEVRAGETMAIVGPNGCGKTTLVQLLPRFYDPTKGRITIDGVDIRDVRLRDLRSRFGIVSQETLLFNDTVANNIAQGMPGREPGGDRGGRPQGPRPRVHHREAPRTATTRSSARPAAASPAASGNALRSPGPSCGTRKC